MPSEPMKVVVTGAAGQIAYSILPMIASGKMLGPNQPIVLSLLEIEPAMGALNGVVMELQDCAFPLLSNVIATSDANVAFKDADVAVLVGAFPRKAGMERKDLLEKNCAIFKVQGEALDKHAKRDCKVLVVGNPANTNAFIARHFAPSLPAENFTAMTRLDHNRAKAQVALKTGAAVRDVHNVSIWGNHSATQYPNVSHGYVVGADGKQQSIKEAVKDDAWLQGDFITTVQKRGAAIIEARKLSSAMSAANAAVDHVHDWVLGTPEGEVVSMGVVSDGSYGVPKGLVYSFPCTCKNGKWSIVQGLDIDDFSRQKMEITQKELESERDEALKLLGA